MNRLRKHGLLVQFKEDHVLVPVPVPVSEYGYSLAPATLPMPDHFTMTANEIHLALQKLDSVQ